MRAEEAIETNGRENASPQAVRAGEATEIRREDGSFGQRLGAARDRLGLSRMDVATRLKLPLKLIERLESDDYEGLTQGIFLQGYLASYARLVGVPPDEAARVAAAHVQAAPLVATGTISRSRYLFERYSVSATYLILTAIIVVPAVWLATHGGLQQNLARTTPLDPQVTAVAVPAQEPAAATDLSAAEDGGAVASTAAPVEPPPAPAVEQAPVIASMAPFVTSPAPATEPPAGATGVVGSGDHTLELKLSQQSWVEIFGHDGRKLEYSMLAAGSQRSYRSDGPVSVRLGNAQGAEIRSDGAPVDLAPYQRGNVAHLKLFGADGVGKADQ